MKNIYEIGQKIIPEAMSLLDKRYTILNAIELNEPIGRRTLSANVGLTERVVRSEIDFLKNSDLIDVLPAGMQITEGGKQLLASLKEFMDNAHGLTDREKRLAQILGCKKVIITPGDIATDEQVKKRLGMEAANYLQSVIKENSVIALTGGSTVKAVVDGIKTSAKDRKLRVVPARGGIGRDVEVQSNTLVSRLAKKINARFKLLHAPDNITKETVDALMKEEEIVSTVNLIKQADIVVVGIGRADEMAKRRNLSETESTNLKNKKAVGEAFGSYFDKNRKEVTKRIALGLNINDCSHIDNVIAVSGGSDKAEAILSINFNTKNFVLVTDEGAANKILDIKQMKDE